MLGAVDIFEPEACGRQVKHAEEGLGELVVACGQCAIDFEVPDHSFDTIAQAIEATAPGDGLEAHGARRDDRPDAAPAQITPDVIAVVALVGDDCPRPMVGQIDQGFVAFDVARFAAREVEAERSSATISETVNLTGEPAPRTAKRLFASPPFAPAAETWPRTVVVSRL